MTKDEARDAAWTMMNSGIDGTLDSGHDYFDNGFDAGYDFAKSNDKAVIDVFLARVDKICGSIEDIDLAIKKVYAEMFGREAVLIEPLHHVNQVVFHTFVSPPPPVLPTTPEQVPHPLCSLIELLRLPVRRQGRSQSRPR